MDCIRIFRIFAIVSTVLLNGCCLFARTQAPAPLLSQEMMEEPQFEVRLHQILDPYLIPVPSSLSEPKPTHE